MYARMYVCMYVCMHTSPANHADVYLLLRNACMYSSPSKQRPLARPVRLLTKLSHALHTCMYVYWGLQNNWEWSNGFQRFSSSKLVQKSVEIRRSILNYFANRSTYTCMRMYVYLTIILSQCACKIHAGHVFSLF
jgi:hypothetical protein